MKYNSYFGDVKSYLDLTTNWFNTDKTVLTFTKSFHKLSLTKNEHILKRWNKFGFKAFFHDYVFWFYLGEYLDFVDKSELFTRKIYVNKKGESFIKKDLNNFEEQTLFDIKLSKKTGRCIGLTINKEWEEVYDLFKPIQKNSSEYPNCMKGYRFLPFDKNFKNMSADNLVPVPKGMTIKELNDATSWQKRFEIYPEVENNLLCLDSKQTFRYMLSQPDKVWLNHNIVCIIMDKFAVPFYRDSKTRIEGYEGLWDPPYNYHYYIVNEYARKFGFYPTLDRIVLSFWKLNILFYSTISFLIPPNINDFKILL